MKKESPGADFKEVSNVLGAKWKALSAEEKKPYEDKYQQEKEAYLEVVKQDKREKEALKLLEEEQMQKTAMELLEQYLQFQQVNSWTWIQLFSFVNMFCSVLMMVVQLRKQQVENEGKKVR